MAGLAFAPLTPQRADDLADLFQTDSVARNCWCMFWRLKSAEFQRMDRAALEDAYRSRIDAGPPPGLLAYEGETAVGWVQVTPRDDLPRFNRSRIAGPAGDTGGVWAVSCFFARKSHRGTGITTALARAACAHAAEHGARAVEAAALAPKRPLVWGEGFVGLVPALARAGFREVEWRSETRVLMRWTPEAA